MRQWIRKSMRSVWPLALGLVALVPAGAGAQVTAPETYAGDLWLRPRLTGD